MKRAKETTFQVSLGKWILVCVAHASVSCRVHARLAALFSFLNIQEFRERSHLFGIHYNFKSRLYWNYIN